MNVLQHTGFQAIKVILSLTREGESLSYDTVSLLKALCNATSQSDVAACFEAYELAIPPELLNLFTPKRMGPAPDAFDRPVGSVDNCRMCNDLIIFNGECWEHVTGIPRHPAWPRPRNG